MSYVSRTVLITQRCQSCVSDGRGEVEHEVSCKSKSYAKPVSHDPPFISETARVGEVIFSSHALFANFIGLFLVYLSAFVVA